MAGGTGGQRLASLTGLRFATAFGIFGFHFSPYLAGHAQGVVGDVFNQASAGVSFFFMLSGVVLTWSRHAGDTRRLFYQRRFARVYPDYLAAWILTIAVIAYEGGTFDIHSGGPSLLLIQSWWPHLTVSQGWNGVAWTLSCEAFFYLCFPFIVGQVERMARPLLLIPFLCLPTLVLGLIGTVHDQHSNPETLIWLQTIFPPVRLCEFVVGIALAVELRRGTLPRIAFWVAGVVFAAAYGLFNWAPLHWLAPPVFIPVIALVIVGAAQRDLSGHRTLWSRRTFVLLGERSYAFYLLHQLIIRVWAHAARNHIPITSVPVAVGWYLALLAVAIAAASVLFSVIEVPLERRLRGTSTRRVELDDAPETPKT
jgi:peptidoglycan/LPS O-acetylase OafA/YrhL